MPVRTVRLPAPHLMQRRMIDEAKRFNVACCGRRFGKTTVGIDRLLDAAIRGYPTAWFSPSYRMLTEVWREVRRILVPLAVRVSAQEHRIELLGGGTVDMWSLDNPNVARGRKYRLIVIDEAAMVRNLREAWQAVIRPTLTDYIGGAWFLSTPRGIDYFYELFQLGQDSGQTEWASWQMPTSANPYIEPREIEAARRDLPELVFAQEYLAQFIPDGAGVFRRVLESATATPQAQAVPGHQYIISVDWGKYADWTVLCVVDVTTQEVVCLDRFNQIDYAVQVGRLQALYNRFHPVTIIAERNSMGEPLIEQLQRLGLPVQPFTTTNATKAAVVDALALALEQGAIRILPDPVLIAELHAFRAERLPSGVLRYGAPEGAHDDCVMALALAVWASRPAGQVEFAPSLWI